MKNIIKGLIVLCVGVTIYSVFFGDIKSLNAFGPYDRTVWKISPPTTSTVSGSQVARTTVTLCGDFEVGTSTDTSDKNILFYSTGGAKFYNDVTIGKSGTTKDLILYDVSWTTQPYKIEIISGSITATKL